MVTLICHYNHDEWYCNDDEYHCNDYDHEKGGGRALHPALLCPKWISLLPGHSILTLILIITIFLFILIIILTMIIVILIT